MSVVTFHDGTQIRLDVNENERTLTLTLPSEGGASAGSDEQRVALAIVRNFPKDQWGNALNVARLESGYNKNAHNTNGEDSRGIFQINVGPGANPQWADEDLFDIDTNVRFASIIYAQWGNWGAWYNAATALGLPT